MEDVKLIKCPICGKDVSSVAVSCPNCGHPIKDNASNLSNTREEIKETVNYSSVADYRKPKKKNGCMIGCLIFFILFMFGIGIGVSETVKHPEKYEKIGIVEEALEVDKEVAANIEDILMQCGLTNIKAIQRDELLDNIDFQGEKGYRVEANGLKNIILYLYVDNVVYSVRYFNNNLYLKGSLLSNINDFTMDIGEISEWQVLCKNKVKSILKSPSTAEFPNYKEWAFKKEKNIVTIQGYVDSQNSFGAMIRSEFQFVVDANTDIIQSFIFDGEELIK